jgi:hypothetical protein
MPTLHTTSLTPSLQLLTNSSLPTEANGRPHRAPKWPQVSSTVTNSQQATHKNNGFSSYKWCSPQKHLGTDSHNSEQQNTRAVYWRPTENKQFYRPN